LAEKYKKRIFHNPEFLTEKNAMKDIFKEGRVIIGITNSNDFRKGYEICQMIGDCHIEDYDDWVVDSDISEMVKYITNAFLSTKVAFFNEIDLILRKNKHEWNDLRSLVLLDKRINPSHTIVTKERGFGGTCLPKDLDGLISFSNSKFFKAVKEQNERTKAYKIPQSKHPKH
jgi:UDPglucose 6-dehydrogenase